MKYETFLYGSKKQIEEQQKIDDLFYSAVINYNFEIARQAIHHITNFESINIYAIRYNNHKIIDFLLSIQSGIAYRTIRERNEKVMEYLLEKNINLEKCVDWNYTEDYILETLKKVIRKHKLKLIAQTA
jgi:hypothetical protein